LIKVVFCCIRLIRDYLLMKHTLLAIELEQINCYVKIILI
jgi:hypothetical protein